jgi:hypothetical protein
LPLFTWERAREKHRDLPIFVIERHGLPWAAIRIGHVRRLAELDGAAPPGAIGAIAAGGHLAAEGLTPPGSGIARRH